MWWCGLVLLCVAYADKLEVNKQKEWRLVKINKVPVRGYLDSEELYALYNISYTAVPTRTPENKNKNTRHNMIRHVTLAPRKTTPRHDYAKSTHTLRPDHQPTSSYATTSVHTTTKRQHWSKKGPIKVQIRRVPNQHPLTPRPVDVPRRPRHATQITTELTPPGLLHFWAERFDTHRPIQNTTHDPLGMHYALAPLPRDSKARFKQFSEQGVRRSRSAQGIEELNSWDDRFVLNQARQAPPVPHHNWPAPRRIHSTPRSNRAKFRGRQTRITRATELALFTTATISDQLSISKTRIL